jgi:predicted Zn-dependent protease
MSALLEKDFMVCAFVAGSVIYSPVFSQSLSPWLSMTRKSFLVAALMLCSILGSPLAAQPQKCQPPVALPTSTEPNIFSEEQEVYLGDAVAEYIQRSYHVIEDNDVTAYLTTIGGRLTKYLPLNQLKFQFFLVDLPDANAFVLPGAECTFRVSSYQRPKTKTNSPR